jgi:hypothetical protein
MSAVPIWATEIRFSQLVFASEILSLGGFVRGGLAGFISFFVSEADLTPVHLHTGWGRKRYRTNHMYGRHAGPCHGIAAD